MQKGKFYENKAIEFLKLKGYRIIGRNFRSRFGEIDIIGADGGYTCFIEVKARSSGYLIEPKDAVDWQKIQKIKKTALSYASGNLERLFRFDVLEIIEGKFYRQYNLIKNAFDFDD